MTDKVEDVLIVGAGMAGLMAANTLHGHRLQVRLLDKGRSVGGRLATRRIGPGRADHGAQFFTVRTPEFELWVYRWLRDGLVFRWSTGWSDGSLDTKGKPDGYPRFAVKGGMNALTKHLATGLAIELNVKLVSVSKQGDNWLVIDEKGKRYAGRAVIMTPPVPQGLALLETGQTALSQEDQAALARIEYAPCVAGLFWVDGPVNLPEPGAIQRPGSPISWIADNQRKGISPEATLITVHAGQESSRFLWSQPADEALQALIAGLSPFLENHTKIIESQLKRWRYSLPISLHPERCLTVSQSPPLIFAGDAFGEPRVEGAALSGMAAANKLLSILDHHSVYSNAK
jgi:predicted NAD/FAD-dependent oxidoreductase